MSAGGVTTIKLLDVCVMTSITGAKPGCVQVQPWDWITIHYEDGLVLHVDAYKPKDNETRLVKWVVTYSSHPTLLLAMSGVLESATALRP